MKLYLYDCANICLLSKHKGPVVQNFVSLTLSLSPLSVNYISTSKASTVYFWLKNVRILCNAKDSHIFSTKNNRLLVSFPFEFLTNR